MTSVALEGLKNNLNNYKGVMLCTRPNENITTNKEKPFVSRVDPKESLGINPVKKGQTHVVAKRANPVLQRHRAWLQDFKERMRAKRMQEEMKDQTEKERFERIREKAASQRVITHEYTEQSPNATGSELNKSPLKSSQPDQSPPVVKKQEQKKKENKEKPKWAYTEKQVKDEEEEEVDDLLQFANNLDYDEYINDLEVKHMINALKKRIDELNNKEEDDWKKKIVDAWNNEEDNKKILKPSKVDLGYDDARSDVRSVASESKSVASERTHKSISELKSKLDTKEKKDWDHLSTTSKKKQVTIEERIAKHIADEILRNNTEFRHYHSNASVRKILEKEAQKHLEEVKGINPPEIVSNKEYFARKDVRDPNNLPYLHRNPAI